MKERKKWSTIAITLYVLAVVLAVVLVVENVYM